MSISYVVRAAGTNAKWPLSGNVIDVIGRLCGRDTGISQLLSTVGLAPWTELGVQVVVQRAQLVSALKAILESAKVMPNGFQLRLKGFLGNPDEQICRAASGLLIDGRAFAVSCYYEYWKLIAVASTSSELSDVSSSEVDVVTTLRYEPAEIKVDNCELVRVEQKKGRSELHRLLSGTLKVVKASHEDKFDIVCG